MINNKKGVFVHMDWFMTSDKTSVMSSPYLSLTFLLCFSYYGRVKVSSWSHVSLIIVSSLSLTFLAHVGTYSVACPWLFDTKNAIIPTLRYRLTLPQSFVNGSLTLPNYFLNLRVTKCNCFVVLLSKMSNFNSNVWKR